MLQSVDVLLDEPLADRLLFLLALRLAHLALGIGEAGRANFVDVTRRNPVRDRLVDLRAVVHLSLVRPVAAMAPTTLLVPATQEVTDAVDLGAVSDVLVLAFLVLDVDGMQELFLAILVLELDAEDRLVRPFQAARQLEMRLDITPPPLLRVELDLLLARPGLQIDDAYRGHRPDHADHVFPVLPQPLAGIAVPEIGRPLGHLLNRIESLLRVAVGVDAVV